MGSGHWNMVGVVEAGKLDPAGLARPSLSGGAQGADGNRRLPNLPRGFLLQPSVRAKRAGAFRHGFMMGHIKSEGKRGPRPCFEIVLGLTVGRPV